jgi:hypothetical protein
MPAQLALRLVQQSSIGSGLLKFGARLTQTIPVASMMRNVGLPSATSRSA